MSLIVVLTFALAQISGPYSSETGDNTALRPGVVNENTRILIGESREVPSEARGAAGENTCGSEGRRGDTLRPRAAGEDNRFAESQPQEDWFLVGGAKDYEELKPYRREAIDNFFDEERFEADMRQWVLSLGRLTKDKDKKETGYNLFLMDEGKIAGYVHFIIVDDEKQKVTYVRRTRESTIYVRESFRRRGLGTRLCKIWFERLRDIHNYRVGMKRRGIKYVELLIARDPVAIAFWNNILHAELTLDSVLELYLNLYMGVLSKEEITELADRIYLSRTISLVDAAEASKQLQTCI